MMISAALLALSALPAVLAQETIWGVYIFSRHGDRTPKILGSTALTQLGYQQVYQRGEYYRSRYIASDASAQITGIAPDAVRLSQLVVTAPVDNVLQSSAAGFLQGLYPPFATSQTLRNGTVVAAPMDGYQIIPIQISTSGNGAEDATWLQASTGCGNALTSSNNYFLSDVYETTLNSTMQFYQDLVPVVNTTFTADATTFKNAYSVYDYINVAEIHNETIPSSDLLTNDTLYQLLTRAHEHEFGLAYNATDNVRAIAGMQLAAEIVDALNATIIGGAKTKLNIQFGAYATFLAFFGLANLTAASPDFYGVNDYASSMVFELFSNTSSTTIPAAEDLQVRFLWHNGTSAPSSDPIAYPLFGQSETALPWTSFASELAKFSIGTTEAWCTTCGNTTGTCAPYASGSSSSSSSSGSGSSSSGGMSKAVAGVIGAIVTLAVILGLEALVLLVSGYKLISKKKLSSSPAVSEAKV